jgi:hypothetical protein
MIFALLSALSACSKRDHQVLPQQRVIPIAGDPMNFIRNTTKDDSSGISLSSIDLTKKYFIQRKGFYETPQIVVEDLQQAMERQRPPEEVPEPELDKYIWRVGEGERNHPSKGPLRYTHRLYPEGDDGIIFYFVEQDQALKLVDLSLLTVPMAELITLRLSITQSTRIF